MSNHQQVDLLRRVWVRPVPRLRLHQQLCNLATVDESFSATRCVFSASVACFRQTVKYCLLIMATGNLGFLIKNGFLPPTSTIYHPLNSCLKSNPKLSCSILLSYTCEMWKYPRHDIVHAYTIAYNITQYITWHIFVCAAEIWLMGMPRFWITLLRISE